MDNVNQKFTGQYRDSETLNDFFNARYYTAPLMRFLSPDPGNAGADLTDPQTWNAYAYVRNNPLIYTDPSGRSIWSAIGDFFSGLFGGGGGNQDDGEGPVWTEYPDPNSGGDGIDICWECGVFSFSTTKTGSAPGKGHQTPKNPARSSSPVSGPCVAPNLLQRAGIAVQAGIASFFNKTIGVGAGGSAGAGNKVGVSLSVSRQLVVAPNGQAGFATTVTSFNGQIFNSATTSGYGGYGGFQLSVSNASNINLLGGSSLNYGYGGGSGLGGGFDFSTDLQTWQATGTVGGGFGGYGHGLTSVTTSITPICGG